MIYTIMDVFFFEYEIFCNSECLPVCVCVLADIFARAKTSQKYFMVEEDEGGGGGGNHLKLLSKELEKY